MNQSLSGIEPKELWNHFSQLNAIPRPSKKEERVIEFIVNFGKKLGLETTTDSVGNVIIKKPASIGMEGKQTTVLQSHLDMVHQKNADTDFDFNSQGIDMFIDGDWVKAKGTTLGADNGIGVASIMTILASNTISHPPIEALFTIDEETGMTGALGLEAGLLSGKFLLNLDTEDDRELTIGCAGGIDVTATGTYITNAVTGKVNAFTLKVKGLSGGHSGMDIHLGRGNANKLMNRILTLSSNQFNIGIHAIEGGSLRNAIPRESVALIIVPTENSLNFESFIKEINQVIQAEYRVTDPNLVITSESADVPETIMHPDFQYKVLRTLYACPCGIFRMSPDIDRLVQTSNNLARVVIKNGEYSFQCLTRSSVDSEKMDLADAIKSTFELAGASVSYAGSYPGWTPKPQSSLVTLMSGLYSELYQSNAVVSACHAGLECGILGKNYPHMEMISFGPNIRGAHSPDEKVQISSVQKYWSFLLETLKRIPNN